jgi:hypothetical protein
MLKNDAILEIDVKKLCNIGIDVKSDAILEIDVKKRCNIGRCNFFFA